MKLTVNRDSRRKIRQLLRIIYQKNQKIRFLYLKLKT